jgi:5-(carboxyamino)imidazole ribonucleotide synthase
VADVEINAEYDDLDAVRSFAQRVDVVTFEFENVPVETTRLVEQWAPVRPGGHVLHTTQNRLREKKFLRGAGLPTTPFAEVDSPRSLAEALKITGTPAILKTAAWGYDGKGQSLVKSVRDAEQAWQRLGCPPAILEQVVDFESELSVVATRGLDGQFVAFPPITNVHRHHILDLSMAPAIVPPRTALSAIDLAAEVHKQLDVVGVLCVEFFVTKAGDLLINELAPRPHNSGHLTIDAHSSSQFEQQVRAVCGLRLGSTQQHRPAAMANLLGDLWVSAEPDWAAALNIREIKLHLYGKSEPRVGRKMGHLTALADSVGSAAGLAERARNCLHRVDGSRVAAACTRDSFETAGDDPLSAALVSAPGRAAESG